MATPRRPAPTRAHPVRRAAAALAGGRWRLPALLAVPVGATLLLLVGVLLGGGGSAGGVDLAAIGGAPGVGSSEGGGKDGVSSATAGFPGAAPETTATPDNVVRSIEELHRVYGEPPFADLGRMRIPALGIDAPLSLRIVGEDGAMPNPEGPDEVSLYDLSAWPGLGGRPGAPGNAIFAGHVDRTAWLDYAQLEYSGLAVFFHLDKLSPGQVIEVDDASGATHRYVVQWVREVPASGGAWAEILAAPEDAETITLITCGGDFNAVEGSYASRVVVRAAKGG